MVLMTCSHCHLTKEEHTSDDRDRGECFLLEAGSGARTTNGW